MPEVTVIHGDCREAMKGLEENSVDAIVTDPPYELDFMGSAWDRSGIAFDGDVWREAMRVLKPGGFCLAFGATRTYHRVVCAIEDAGFHIREMHLWLHGQGMNKVGYLREADGEKHIRQGWGGSVRPMVEPIVVARKPLGERTLAENMRRWGVGGYNVDGCRVPAPEGLTRGGQSGRATHFNDAARGMSKVIKSEAHEAGRWPPNVILDGSQAVLDLFPPGRSSGVYNRDPTTVQTKNVYGQFNGVISDVMYADSGSAARFFPSFPPDDAPAKYCGKATKAERVSRCTGCGWRTMGKVPEACPDCGATGSGTWAGHPTVKPVALMRWLCRLVTPPGGTVLDPFAGTGTTLVAARAEGFGAIGIEQDVESVADIRHRLGLPQAA